MKTTIRTTLAALVAWLVIQTMPVSAGPGDLDTTFDGDGKTTTLFGGQEGANAVALQVIDGKVLAGGFTDSGLGGDFALARYNPDGTLDTSFGFSGRMQTDFGGNDTCFDVGVLVTGVNANDPILVIAVGLAFDGANSNAAIACYDWVTGLPVAAFGGTGKVTLNLGGDEDFQSVVFQPGNKIVAGGSSDGGGDAEFALVRFLTNGSFDPSFGSSGLVLTDFFGEGDACYDLAVQADGKILAGGVATSGGAGRFTIVRYTPEGSLDTSFGSGGKVFVTFPGFSSADCEKIAVLPDGKIVGVGNVSSDAIALVRLNPDGSLDTTFGSGGTVVTAGTGAGFLDGIPGLVLQGDGKILVMGRGFKVIRVRQNGTLDTAFGQGGSTTVDFGKGFNYAAGATIRANGTVVVAGSISPTFGTGDFAIASLKTAQGDARVGTTPKVPRGSDVYNTTGAGQSQSVAISRGGGTKTVFVGIQNDTATRDSFKIKGTPSNGEFSVKYLHDGTDVTRRVFDGTLNTGRLNSGAIYLLKARITAATPLAGKTRNFSIIPTSAADPTAKDRVHIKARSK